MLDEMGIMWAMERLPSLIKTERLTLRHWTPEDVPALNAAVTASIEHLRPFMVWIAHEPMTVEARVDLINGWRRDWEVNGDSILGVFLDEKPIGSAGLHRRNGENTLEIGYWIHKDFTRRGFASEVSAGLTDAAFAIPGVERVEIHHDKANTASAGVPRSLGFIMFVEAPRKIEAPGQVGIDCKWVMTREGWSTRPPRS